LWPLSFSDISQPRLKKVSDNKKPGIFCSHCGFTSGEERDVPVPAIGTAVVAGGARRPQSRNVRARVAALRRARGEDEPVAVGGAQVGQDDSGEEEERYVDELVDEMVEKEERKAGKVGTKKLKRIQEKAERKAMREVSPCLTQ
jgi:hypothetical protein